MLSFPKGNICHLDCEENFLRFGSLSVSVRGADGEGAVVDGLDEAPLELDGDGSGDVLQLRGGPPPAVLGSVRHLRLLRLPGIVGLLLVPFFLLLFLVFLLLSLQLQFPRLHFVEVVGAHLESEFIDYGYFP